MNKVKKDNKYLIVVCTFMLIPSYYFLSQTGLFKEPLLAATLTLIATLFFMLYLIEKNPNGLYLGPEGCRYRAGKIDIFLNWNEINVEIEKKYPFFKNYIISLKNHSLHYSLDVTTRKSFFELAKNHAPANHNIRNIESQYTKEFGE